jgi:hypothetical protein
MDTLIQTYLEETEDMLQRAEECIMRLEVDYSDLDVNELFRIAHTIKGSSQMVGYEDIGNLMHRVEDMLHFARNGSIIFNQSIVDICFEALDIVKKMLQYKNELGSQEIMDSINNSTFRISEKIQVILRKDVKETPKDVIESSEDGIISSILCKEPKGENKYYITFFIQEDAPMVSPVIIMILNGIQEIGTLIYSSVDDKYFLETSVDNDMKMFDVIIDTDVNEAELYTYFSLSYIEKINIVDLSRCKVEQNDYSFTDDENTVYLIIMKAFVNIYKIVFSLSKQLKISKKNANIMKSLHCEAVNAANRIKNKEKISSFIKDFDEIYNKIINMNELQFQVRKEFVPIIKEQMASMMERAYKHTKGKNIVSVFKAGQGNFINGLKNFIEMLNKSSTVILLIDLSKLNMLHENEVKYVIDIKKRMQDKDIEIGIIAEGTNAIRIINIFDSIKQVEEFHVFHSELEAILVICNCDHSFPRVVKRLKDVQYDFI